MFSNKTIFKLFSLALSIVLGFVICKNTYAYEASITTSGNIDLNVMTTGTGAGIATDNVNVVSTCPTGYSLYVAATSSTNNSFNDTTLYKSGNSTDTNMITASAGTVASPASITGNNLGTWGYSTTSSSATGTFIGLTTTPTIINTKDSASASSGDNNTIYYGASATTTLEPGVYKMSDDAVITYYLTTSLECSKYTIAYDDNDATAGTMGIQTQDDNGDYLVDNSEVTLFPSNYNRTNYGFAGWSLVELDPDSANFSTAFQSAINAGKVFGPQETITLDSAITSEADSSGVITMYAIWIKAETGVTLQSWNGCSAMTATTYTGDATDQNIWSITASANSLVALKDERDNETYAIAKLSDGNCWMIENLRLADKDHNNNDVILSSANTNNPSLPLTNIYDTSSTSNHLSPTSSIAYDASTAPEGWCTTNSAACFDQSRLRTDNTTNRVSYTATQTMSADANFYSYGNYYNWYSATAGNGKYSTGSNVIVSGDICPAGWHLPYGNNGSDTSGGNTSGGFYYLANSMSATTSDAINSKKHRHFPNNYLYSGLINGASPGNLGSYGNYWSTTVYNNNSAYNLRISSSSIDPGTGYNYKHYGRSIRCVASAGYTVSFNANGGTGAMSDQSIPVGVATNLTSNSFTRTGYEFAGWNTAADGFGTSYTDAQSVTNLALPGRTITLYAQWEDCPGGNICYRANGSSVEGTMGRQAVGASDTSITLLASNFSRTGYGFAGWNTQPDYSGTFYGPQEDMNFIAGAYSSDGLRLYAVWVASAGSLQDSSKVSTLCGTGAGSLVPAPTNGTANLSSVSALTDQRDGQTYAIAKLSDNKCWMIENLRLENANSDNSTGALAQGYAGQFAGLADPETPWGSNSVVANSLYSEDGADGTIGIGTNDSGFRFPRYNNNNTTSRSLYPTDGSVATYSYGNYYTWAAAIANTSSYSEVDTSVVGSSICPAGWHLPTGGGAYASDNTGNVNVNGNISTYSDSYYLSYKLMDEIKTAYDDTPNGWSSYYSNNTTNLAGDTASNAFRRFPNNFLYSGRAAARNMTGLGTDGYYWTTTTRTSENAYRLIVDVAYVRPGTSHDRKSYGRTVRCLAGS